VFTFHELSCMLIHSFWPLFDASLQNFLLHADNHFKGFLRSEETGTNNVSCLVLSLISSEFPILYVIKHTPFNTLFIIFVKTLSKLKIMLFRNHTNIVIWFGMSVWQSVSIFFHDIITYAVSGIHFVSVSWTKVG